MNKLLDHVNNILDQGEPSRLSLARFIAQFIVGAIGGFIIGMLMLLVAIIIGGNIATNFEFAGSRGYEATGGIGLLIGLVFGTPTLVYAFGRRRNATGTYFRTLLGSVLTAILVGSMILVSPQLRLPDSVFPLTGLLALGATIGYNSTQPLWQVTRYAAGVAVLIVAGWGYTVYQQRFAPTVTVKGELHGGSVMGVNASGDQGTTAYITSAPPAGQVGPDGISMMFNQCVVSPTDRTLPRVTVTGHYFKPDELVRIQADYTGTDCISIFLAGQARADERGSFTVDLGPDPELNAPPPWANGGATFTLTLEGLDFAGTSFAVRVEEAEPTGRPGTEFRLVKLFCGDGQHVPDYDGQVGPPCTAGVYPVRMGAPPEHPMRFRVASFSAVHPMGVTIQEGVTQITDDMHIDVHYAATAPGR